MQYLSSLVRDILEMYGFTSEKEFYQTYLGYSNLKYKIFNFLSIPMSDDNLKFLLRLQLIYRTLYSYNVPHDKIVDMVFKPSQTFEKGFYHELRDDYNYFNLIKYITQKYQK